MNRILTEEESLLLELERSEPNIPDNFENVK